MRFTVGFSTLATTEQSCVDVIADPDKLRDLPLA